MKTVVKSCTFTYVLSAPPTNMRAHLFLQLVAEKKVRDFSRLDLEVRAYIKWFESGQGLPCNLISGLEASASSAANELIKY